MESRLKTGEKTPVGIVNDDVSDNDGNERSIKQEGIVSKQMSPLNNTECYRYCSYPWNRMKK